MGVPGECVTRRPEAVGGDDPGIFDHADQRFLVLFSQLVRLRLGVGSREDCRQPTARLMVVNEAGDSLDEIVALRDLVLCGAIDEKLNKPSGQGVNRRFHRQRVLGVSHCVSAVAAVCYLSMLGQGDRSCAGVGV